LRALIHVGDNELAINGKNFDLQVAKRGTDNDCDTSFTNETYADIDGTTDIRFFNNSGATDEDNISATSSDPVHEDHTVNPQDYQEANVFTNSVGAIPAGEDGLWDFSLVDIAAPQDTHYCFKIQNNTDNQDLDTYTVIPEIITAQLIKIRLRGAVRLRVVRLR